MNHTPMLMPMAISSPVQREKFDSRIMFTLQPSLEKRLDSYVADQNSNRSEAIRDALEMLLNPQPLITAETGTDAFRAPNIGNVPCGPLAPAVAEASSFVCSPDVADELEAREGDVWMRAAGDSMLGAGIADGVMVLTRPYDGKAPRRGDIVAAQIETPDGERVGTIKRYNGETDGRPHLIDGEDENYALPDDAVKVDFVARVVGVLGRI